MYAFVSRRRVLLKALSNSISNKSTVHDLSTAHLGLYSSLCLFQSARLLRFGTTLFSTETKVVKLKRREECTFTVSYLINSCGLSPEVAKSVSKKVKLLSAEQPDSILKLLRKHGFNDTHIAKLVRLRPLLLLSHPDRTISPKFEFFNSIGVTDAEIADVCSSIPGILGGSLDNLLIPNYTFLKSVLISDENVVKAFRKKSWIFQHDLQKKVSPKLEILRKLGMSESFISLILRCYAPIVLQSQDKFDENVKKVIEMGFDPKRCGFIHAMQVFVSMSQKTWEHKLEVLKTWGWSEDDIKMAFKRCPCCMNASEKKIMSAMNLLVKEMGWQPRDIAIYPDIFLMNYEKRVALRCLVIKLLQSKGLIKENLSLSPIMSPDDKKFLDKFVTKYLDKVPQLLSVFHGQKGSLDLKNGASSSKVQKV